MSSSIESSLTDNSNPIHFSSTSVPSSSVSSSSPSVTFSSPSTTPESLNSSSPRSSRPSIFSPGESTFESSPFSLSFSSPSSISSVECEQWRNQSTHRIHSNTKQYETIMPNRIHAQEAIETMSLLQQSPRSDHLASIHLVNSPRMSGEYLPKVGRSRWPKLSSVSPNYPRSLLQPSQCLMRWFLIGLAAALIGWYAVIEAVVKPNHLKEIGGLTGHDKEMYESILKHFDGDRYRGPPSIITQPGPNHSNEIGGLTGDDKKMYESILKHLDGDRDRGPPRPAPSVPSVQPFEPTPIHPSNLATTDPSKSTSSYESTSPTPSSSSSPALSPEQRLPTIPSPAQQVLTPESASASTTTQTQTSSLHSSPKPERAIESEAESPSHNESEHEPIPNASPSPPDPSMPSPSSSSSIFPPPTSQANSTSVSYSTIWSHRRCSSCAFTFPRPPPGSIHSSFFVTAVPNRGAGIGHQFTEWIVGPYLANKFGLTFVYQPFLEQAARWDTFLGLSEGELTLEDVEIMYGPIQRTIQARYPEDPETWKLYNVSIWTDAQLKQILLNTKGYSSFMPDPSQPSTRSSLQSSPNSYLTLPHSTLTPNLTAPILIQSYEISIPLNIDVCEAGILIPVRQKYCLARIRNPVRQKLYDEDRRRNKIVIAWHLRCGDGCFDSYRATSFESITVTSWKAKQIFDRIEPNRELVFHFFSQDPLNGTAEEHFAPLIQRLQPMETRTHWHAKSTSVLHHLITSDILFGSISGFSWLSSLYHNRIAIGSYPGCNDPLDYDRESGEFNEERFIDAWNRHKNELPKFDSFQDCLNIH